jgi:hypothetical protein
MIHSKAAQQVAYAVLCDDVDALTIQRIKNYLAFFIVLYRCGLLCTCEQQDASSQVRRYLIQNDQLGEDPSHPCSIQKLLR